jgi:hypothetical protein
MGKTVEKGFGGNQATGERESPKQKVRGIYSVMRMGVDILYHEQRALGKHREPIPIDRHKNLISEKNFSDAGSSCRMRYVECICQCILTSHQCSYIIRLVALSQLSNSRHSRGR